MYYDLLKNNIKYVPQYREYRDNRENAKNCLYRYCSNCGTKLPDSLRDAWFTTLKQEYGVEDILNKDNKAQNIPKEFLTDEWWKKRGL